MFPLLRTAPQLGEMGELLCIHTKPQQIAHRAIKRLLQLDERFPSCSFVLGWKLVGERHFCDISASKDIHWYVVFTLVFFPGVNWGVRHLLTTHLLIHTFGWCFPCCGLFSGCKLGDERERYQGPQPAYKSRTNPTQIGKFVRFVLGSPQRQITRSVFHWSADVRHCTPIYFTPPPCEVKCVKTLVIKFSSMI